MTFKQIIDRRVALALGISLLLAVLSGGLLIASVVSLRSIEESGYQNTGWDVYSLQAEYYRLQKAIHDARDGDPVALAAVKTRYDVFYSRISDLETGAPAKILMEEPFYRSGLMQLKALAGRLDRAWENAGGDAASILEVMLLELNAHDAMIRNLVGDSRRILNQRNFAGRTKVAELYGWVLVSFVLLFSVASFMFYMMIRQIRRVQEARDEAERANRVMSDFLATMSHEIRTPMNGILGMTHVLLEETPPSEEREKLEIIQESGTILMGLLNDILDISKIEAKRLEVERTDFDIRETLRAVQMLWLPRAANKGLELTLQTEEAVPRRIRSDPDRIRQILNNLVNNAIKFTDEGRVDITVSHKAGEDREERLVFKVKDTGPGIPADTLPRMFEKFAQAGRLRKGQFDGTGLGLAISKQLAELMGGDITVDSIEGEGSTFILSLPFQYCDGEDSLAASDEAGDGQGAGDGKAKREPHPPIRRLRILVVEDNEINRLVLGSMLNKYGHDVDLVHDGSDAVQAVSERNYDLVFMDIQMPGMDGMEATRLIREQVGVAGDVRIVALTANAMAGDRERYLEVGMDDYLAKPIEPGELLAILDKAEQATEKAWLVEQSGDRKEA